MDDNAAGEVLTRYAVVLNDEEQYSIWPADAELPAGWRLEGYSGIQDGCLSYIDTVWTDMRPLSLRRWMDEQAERESVGEQADEAQPPVPAVDESLVSRLSSGQHPLTAGQGDGDLPRLRDAVARGQVLVRFTGTAGGTDLSVRLDPDASDLTALEAGEGTIYIVGYLVLDDEPVHCQASISLPSLSGIGHLVPADMTDDAPADVG